MSPSTKNVWFLVVPRTSMINVAGPWEVLGHANDLLGHEAYRLQAFGPSAPTAQTRFGLCLSGVQPLPSRLGHAPDVVVVAGASPADPLPADHAPLVPWLRRHGPRIETVVSVCTGAFVLGAAGILDGRRATTHWMFLDALRARFPRVQVIDEGIYVEDRGVWTSAGLPPVSTWRWRWSRSATATPWQCGWPSGWCCFYAAPGTRRNSAPPCANRSRSHSHCGAFRLSCSST
jgi:transcriptional regulator GlxA family with amidase domain